MHFDGLVLLTLLLPGGTRRSFRIDVFQHDAQQQNNTLTEGLDVSAEVREALLPKGFANSLFPRWGLQASASRADRKQGPQLRAAHGQARSMQSHSHGAWRPFGPRRATVALNAASGPEEVVDDVEDVKQDRERRVDDGPAELARSGDQEAGTSSVSTLGGDAAAPMPLAAELPADATIAVAGGSTPIGVRVMRSIGAVGWTAMDAAASLEGASALVIISAAAGGEGGVAPEAMKQLMASVPDDGSVRRLVYLSSHGVERTDKLPFSMQNFFGQLDKLRAAEQEIQIRALKKIPSYSILRVGGKMAEDGEGASARCELAPGDNLQGDVPASAVSGVLVQALGRHEVINASFSAGPLAAGGGGGSDAEHWDDQFLRLVGPEIFRQPLRAVSVELCAEWLQDWARGFLKEGQRLTTPVEVEDVAGHGVLLRFLSQGGGYRDLDDEETDDEKWAAADAARKGKRPGAVSDGALFVVAEAGNAAAPPRVRVVRAEMEVEDGAAPKVIKVMSEETVLVRLQNGLTAFDKAQQ